MKNRSYISLFLCMVLVFGLSISAFAVDPPPDGLTDPDAQGGYTDSGYTDSGNTGGDAGYTDNGAADTGATSGGSGIGAITGELPLDQAKDNADAISDAFSGVAPSADDFQKAANFMSPFTRLVRLGVAVLFGGLSLAIFLLTSLDMVFLAVPPLRSLLAGGAVSGAMTPQGGQMGPTAMQGGGMYGAGGGMYGAGARRGGMYGPAGVGMYGPAGGYGQPGMQQAPATGGALGTLTKWVSDEATSAYLEAAQGAMTPQGEVRTKSLLLTYLKKRTVFLVLFGFCLVVFSTTLFTDLGLHIGGWLINLFGSFGG